VLAVLAVVVALQPAQFHIERSTTTAAPPATVFAQVNDFHAWRAWSPWEKLDPNMRRMFDGPGSGVGAKYSWSGNDDVGEGKMTIEGSDAPSHIEIKLEFIKPFAATNTATFKFVPEGNGTKITWSMDGNNNFMAKAFGMVMNMDQLVGKDFELGLAQLKKVAEAKSGQAATK
jgi:carbon monoxide dehydrogenase subunit G